MTFTRGAQRATIAVFFCVVAAIYVFAWSLPAVGFDHDDANFLIAAKSIAAGHGYRGEDAPLFPALLALFTLASQQTEWLKVLPLVCAVGWFILTRNLLLKMGASQNGALLLIGLTAASPTVVFLSTNLLPETLFALLATGALLALLGEHAVLAGALAGFATLTQTGGVALIVACILTLVARRRLRAAAIFAAAAMAIAAPWFGWSLAHLPHDANHVPREIFTGLEASEKLVVLFQNFLTLLASPFSLLAGFNNAWFVIGTIVILARVIFVRRQLMPDLFVALYALSLLFWITPPERYAAPVLPLFFWIVWRAIRLMRNREALAAIVLIALGTPLVADGIRILPAHKDGAFAREGRPADNWNSMRRLFESVRDNTAPDSVVLANLDGAFFLNTGRKTVRGFVPNNYDLYYLKRQSPITPDQLLKAIFEQHAGWVVLTPDYGLAESPSFRGSVEALERGGVVEPVSVPGLPRDYQLFEVTSH